MALSNGTTFDSGPLVFLSPRAKDGEGHKIDPYFSVGRVGDDNKIATTNEKPTNVSGDLVRIDVKEREFTTKTGAKDTMKEAVFYIRDREAKETYRLAIGFNLAGRSLFNAFAALTEKGDGSNISIDFYRNRKDFEAFALKQHGENVKWKYGLESLPKPEAIMFKGKLVKNDYTEINNFFEKELLALAAKVNKTPSGHTENASEVGADDGENVEPTVAPARSAKPPSKPVAAPVHQENLDEDVPF